MTLSANGRRYLVSEEKAKELDRLGITNESVLGAWLEANAVRVTDSVPMHESIQQGKSLLLEGNGWNNGKNLY